MKAIIITFHGDFNSENHEEDTLSAIVGCLVARTNANVETTKASTFNDEEVHKMLMANGTLQIFKQRTPKTNEAEARLINTKRFCNTFFEVVGNPNSHYDNESLKKLMVGALLNGRFNEIRNVIPFIASINDTKEFLEERKILMAYKLSFVPKYLNEINGILKLF